MTPERISWGVLFPLQLYFTWNERWILFGLTLILSTLVLVFRGTLNNIRIGFRTRVLQHEQDVRDRCASRCVEALRSGCTWPRPIVLLLRPFAGDKSIRLRDPASPDGLDPKPIESRLLDGFRRWATTLSLGTPWEGLSEWGDVYADMPTDVSIGDDKFYKYEGRLFYERFGEILAPDDRWFDDFKLLVHNADLIISIPISASLGNEESSTVQELLHLASTDALDRCLFVMPPEQNIFQIRSRPVEKQESLSPWIDTTISAGWERTRAALAKNGIELPPFGPVEHDLAFMRYDDGVWYTAGVPLADVPHLRKALRKVGLSL